ncbi:MAG: lysophospholipid acyltransferase family protein [Gammaproteobacteria bacterium]
MFSIDSLINNYYPKLNNKKGFTRKHITALLRTLFHESEIQQFERKYAYLEGFDFIDEVLRYFDFTYKISGRDLERIPSHGRVIVIANHPIGTLDGLAILNLVRKVRPDVKAVANEFLSRFEAYSPVLLPIDNMSGKTPRENLRNIGAYLKQEGAVIIFPAGEVSRMSPSGVRDGKWNKGFLRYAKDTRSPILPIYVDGRNSMFFYALSIVARPLSTLWLIHEMFKQEKNTIEFRVGNKVDYETYVELKFSAIEIAQMFRRHLYRIGKNKKPLFETRESIAQPESAQQIRRELQDCELLGETADGKRIYLFHYQSNTAIMREIGRLRELSFRAVGEGTSSYRDIDAFDRNYMHLILWDDLELEIAGAYRFCDTNMIMSIHGIDGIYTSSLFSFNRDMSNYFYRGLEVGRSFVQPKYWGKRSLDYLWFGIGALLKRNPQYRYLFGPVSISDRYSTEAKNMLVYFYSQYFGSEHRPATALNPFVVSDDARHELEGLFCSTDYKKDFQTLKAHLDEMGYSVPTLYKQYTEICEPGGVFFSDFNIDPGFGDCVDGFVIVDTEQAKPSKRKRYLADEITSD